MIGPWQLNEEMVEVNTRRVTVELEIEVEILFRAQVRRGKYKPLAHAGAVIHSSHTLHD